MELGEKTMKHLFGLYSKFAIVGKPYECVGFVKSEGVWSVLASDGSTFPLKVIEAMF